MKDQIGVKIKEMRKIAGLTQEELGTRIGVTKATVNKYETGIVVNLKRPVIESIASALDTTPAYLMGWQENNESTVHIDNVHSNNGIIGHATGTVTFTNGKSTERELSKEEIEILRIYNKLDVKSRMKLLATAIDLEEK